MKICSKCRTYLPDISTGTHIFGHTCIGNPTYDVVVERRPLGQKCDICGSIAIDHTEMQCQLNRQFLSYSKVSKAKKNNTSEVKNTKKLGKRSKI